MENGCYTRQSKESLAINNTGYCKKKKSYRLRTRLSTKNPKNLRIVCQTKDTNNNTRYSKMTSVY